MGLFGRDVSAAIDKDEEGDQPQDRESPRPHRATDVARPRRRGDRMRAATSEFGTNATSRDVRFVAGLGA